MTIKSQGAVIRQAPGAYETVSLEVDDPRAGEIRIRLVASGMCHSDDHFATGDMKPAIYPWLGGHEGAGVVESVGPHTQGFEVGDHVITSFLPACGRCRWCAEGKQNLCDLGATLLQGARFDDPTSYRVHLEDGTDVGQMCGIGTFSQYTTVSTQSAVKVDKDVDLTKVCLLGCAVGTGWGSAVNAGQTRPGDVVLVIGAGGVGMNAVQGARHAGADHVIVVDPVEFKRESSYVFGATKAFEKVEEAIEYAQSLTNGQGADVAIETVGRASGEHIAQAFSAVRKAGTVVATGIGDMTEVGLPIPITELVVYQKRIQGTHFGHCTPSSDILRQLQMYRDGRLKVDELVTRTYGIDEVAQAYRDLADGLNIRGVIVFD